MPLSEHIADAIPPEPEERRSILLAVFLLSVSLGYLSRLLG